MRIEGLTIEEYEAIIAVEGQKLTPQAKERLIAVRNGQITAAEARARCLEEIRSKNK